MNCLECGIEGEGITKKNPYHKECFQPAFVKALQSMSRQLTKEKEEKANAKV
jgi:hypothetical protein